jgi:predicted hydrocarbon binding protein
MGEVAVHGSIFFELGRYADGRFGEGTFHRMLGSAGLGERASEATLAYSDAEAAALVRAASLTFGKSEAQVLQDFGHHFSSELLRASAAPIDPSWRTLDVLEHSEATILRVACAGDSSTGLPTLRVVRVNTREAIVHLTSSRGLCALARGVVEGIADHYEEDISIVETQCTHRGDAECRIQVRKKITGALPAV